MIDVHRSTDVPASLAANDRHDGEDVVEALHRDFRGKCYLCETQVRLGTFTIDHRKPKGDGQFPELRCAWTNLFPTCRVHDCNGRRQKLYPEGGLLDPGLDHDLEQRLVQRLTHPSAVLASGEASFTFGAAHGDDVAARNTAQELDRVHNGTGSSSKAQRTARALREAILHQMGLVAEQIRRLESATQDERPAQEEAVRKLLGREAPYTMLLRSVFALRPSARALFP